MHAAPLSCTQFHNGYFVDLFVRKSNDVAVGMYNKLGYIVYRGGWDGCRRTASWAASCTERWVGCTLMVGSVVYCKVLEARSRNMSQDALVIFEAV